jgi:hypothetical protein
VRGPDAEPTASNPRNVLNDANQDLPMYIVLTGAKKNAGDELIVERCTALLQRAKPQQELKRIPSWEPLDPALVAQADAIIIPGGPGYQPKMYPHIYPLLPKERVRDLPLFAVGMGWKGIPGDRHSIDTYRFTPTSVELLRAMDERGALSCRDYPTAEVLRRQGLENVVMSGCPVWYDLASIGKPFQRPQSIRKLIFTPAQSPLFAEQSIAVARVLAELFPSAERVCSFHRGIDKADAWVSADEARNNGRIAEAARSLGFEIVDVSVGNGDLGFYRDFDLHVGYRVHAHILFLSARRASLLLHEDGRGTGASESLGIRGIDAFQRSGLGTLAHELETSGPLSRWPFKKVLRGLKFKQFHSAPSAAEAVRAQLELDLSSGFARYAGIASRLDSQFEVMNEFLARLPDAKN